ncbi:PREDICTED: ABC transporter G family member 15-like isoform X2 [Lupinus angustifolius]|uniref:ABC transporter G family member 15-like isoform X2 n=1 Tax=Lupinus angustifolius TaxID=3871 RepID=UPI00092E32D0|nr:PREDICTED: ABC transporter G family member 15-like isoform X2 [Lupinus angustifolius]
MGGMVMVWEDLTVELRSFGEDSSQYKKLLNGLTGFAEPGKIMAIMGSSGCGKTTLLDSLAGRVSANVIVTGSILMNRKKRNLYCREVSYVAQEELLLGTLTVRETLTYSANMRLPSKMSKEEIKKVVEETIMKMGLEECADNTIGNWHLRGLSNGEKKRVSIGLEILTKPHVLLLDEPTSGLDSASAFYVIQALRNIACNGGKIIICSIHQPSSEVFNLFDDLLLLSNGETVYFGEAKMALKFFADAGFPCPTRRNPSDHFLMCTNLDFDLITETLARLQLSTLTSSNFVVKMRTAQIRAKLIESFKCSELMINTRRRIQMLQPNEEQVIESKVRRSTSWWKQLRTVTQRSFLNMSRDIGYYSLRIIFYILVSITIGIIFFHIGTDSNSILSRGKCISFIYGFMICLSCGGLPFFIEELKLFYVERSKGHYGEAAFVLANIISSFPFLLVISIFCGVIIYFMVQFHAGATNLAFFCINLFCCLSVAETCIMTVASVVPNVLMGIGTGTGVLIFMMMPSQIFRRLPDIPKFFWRYPMSYLSFTTWAMQGQYKNDMLGLEFDPLLPGDPKLSGEQVLTIVFGVPLNHGKWWDLTALITLLILHRLILFLVLRYYKRPKSTMLWFYAKERMQLAKRCLMSTNKRYISSKNKAAPHPLSSQEGLMSPNFAI